MKYIVYVIIIYVQLINGKQGFGPYEQEWGYINVRDGAYIFWWLYECNNCNHRPLLIWLPGAPGFSSGYGNLVEIGPLDLDLQNRTNTWMTNYNVLFVDIPVGSGFSYVDHPSQYSTNNVEIANDFLQFLNQFYQKLPKFKNNPLYIFGASYGGKLAVHIAFGIHLENQKKSLNKGCRINIKGVGLDSPWISPIDSVLMWPQYLYQMGEIDKNGFKVLSTLTSSFQNAIDMENYIKAFDIEARMEFVVQNVISKLDMYNILAKISPDRASNREENMMKATLLMNSKVKESLKINTVWVADASDVKDNLKSDIMTSATRITERLLNETSIEIAVYNGQLDLLMCVAGTMRWIEQLSWKQSKEWNDSNRTTFLINDVYEGYVKKFGQLSMYWIKRAGHTITVENPQAIRYIVDHMTHSIG